jgi:hypothetical protein
LGIFQEEPDAVKTDEDVTGSLKGDITSFPGQCLYSAVKSAPVFLKRTFHFS